MLEDTSDLGFGDLGDGENLAESSRHLALTACDEDTSGNDRFLRFPSESSLLLDDFEKMFGGVRDVFRDSHPVAESSYLFVGRQEGFGSFIMCCLVLSATKVTSSGRSTATKGDARLKLGAVEQRIGTVSNARWIIVILIIVCEGPPFGPGVNNTITKDQTTRSTNSVAGSEVLNNVRRIFFAVFTDQVHGKVLSPWLLRFDIRNGSDGHDGRRWIRHLPENGTFYRFLARLSVGAPGGRKRIELLIAMTDEEWRIQLDGVQ